MITLVGPPGKKQRTPDNMSETGVARDPPIFQASHDMLIIIAMTCAPVESSSFDAFLPSLRILILLQRTCKGCWDKIFDTWWARMKLCFSCPGGVHTTPDSKTRSKDLFASMWLRQAEWMRFMGFNGKRPTVFISPSLAIKHGPFSKIPFTKLAVPTTAVSETGKSQKRHLPTTLLAALALFELGPLDNGPNDRTTSNVLNEKESKKALARATIRARGLMVYSICGHLSDVDCGVRRWTKSIDTVNQDNRLTPHFSLQHPTFALTMEMASALRNHYTYERLVCTNKASGVVWEWVSETDASSSTLPITNLVATVRYLDVVLAPLHLVAKHSPPEAGCTTREQFADLTASRETVFFPHGAYVDRTMCVRNCGRPNRLQCAKAQCEECSEEEELGYVPQPVPKIGMIPPIGVGSLLWI